MYVWVYAMIYLSDWIPAAYTYTYFSRVGFDSDKITSFYTTSIVTSTICCIVAGNIIDRYGRKFGCVAYCVFAILANALKMSPTDSSIYFGQICGGIANTLLYTAFEGWLTGFYEANQSDELTPIEHVFSSGTLFCGMAAIASGVISYYSSSYFGELSPFILSIVVLIPPMYQIVRAWPENWGYEEIESVNTEKNTKSWYLSIIVFIQIAMESSLNVVILKWTPTLSNLFHEDSKQFPFGIVFSTMMAGMMVGSQLYKRMILLVSNRTIISLTLMVTAVAFFACAVFQVILC
jgi:MFS family permease